MPNYIPDAQKRLKCEKPKIWQGSPHRYTVSNYGAKQEFAETESNEPVLVKEAKKYTQQVLGTFLYYARAVDPTMLVALSAITSEQASPTRATMKNWISFWIMQIHKNRLYSHMKHPTWFQQSTATPRSSANPRQEAGLVDNFSCPRMPLSPPTMELCST